MEKTQHIFEERVYLISNHSVALNPMFTNKDLQVYFIKKMEHYLGQICSILNYSLSDCEFKLLLKTKDRATFERYYLEKHEDKDVVLEDVPESTYIFSQSMSNLQVSYVKHLNFVEGRSGTLMASRFCRRLIESEEEMRIFQEDLNRGVRSEKFSDRWKNIYCKQVFMETSAWMYEDRSGGSLEIQKPYEVIDISDLVGMFKKPHKHSLNSTKSFHERKLYRLFCKE